MPARMYVCMHAHTYARMYVPQRHPGHPVRANERGTCVAHLLDVKPDTRRRSAPADVVKSIFRALMFLQLRAARSQHTRAAQAVLQLELKGKVPDGINARAKVPEDAREGGAAVARSAALLPHELGG